jgi:importin subunit alpha-6/7
VPSSQPPWCMCSSQAVIDANIISPLVALLASAEFDVKKEAAWAISNATSGGTAEQIRYLVDHGCIKPLCDLLTCPEVRIISVAMEGLENILKVGEQMAKAPGGAGVNPYASLIEDAEGLDKIEKLQDHTNEDIYEKAQNLLTNYFDLEEEEGENLAPQHGQNMYAFGAAPAQGAPQGGFNFGDAAQGSQFQF